MLFFTLIFIIVQIAVAVTAPGRFIYLSLWVQTMPYTWNWDAQLVFDTPLGPLNVVAMQLFGFCLSCLLVVFSHFDRVVTASKRYRWHAVFIGFCIASLSFAPSTAYGLRMIAKLLGPLLFLMIVLAVPRSEEELQKVQQAITGSGAALIALALIAKVAGIDSDPNFVNTGYSGLGPPSMGPPVFSAHMLPVAMLALSAFLTAPKTVNFLWVLAVAAAIVASLQRTSAGALYAGFSIILFFGTRGILRVLLPTAGLLGLPLLLLFSATFRGRMFFENAGSEELIADPAKALSKVNGSGRFDLWDNVLARFFKPHPTFGSGIGATQDYLYAQSMRGAGVVHSEYVRLLCEVGVVGLALFSLAIAAYVLQLRKYAANTNSVALRTPALAAIGSLVAYLVYCSTDNSFDYVSQFGIYVFGLVAVAMKSSDLTSVVREEAGDKRVRPALFPHLLR